MRSIVLLLLAFAVTITGCNGEEGRVRPESLTGTSWKLVGWSASSINPAPFTMTANFDGKSMSGRAAVNSYGGAYPASSDGSIRIGPLVATEMAGSPEAMRAEQRYFELIERVRRYRIENNQLDLLDEGGQELLVFDAM